VLQSVLARLPEVELFARFVELDAASEGKDLTFLWWFRRELAIVGLLSAHAEGGPDGEREDVVYATWMLPRTSSTRLRRCSTTCSMGSMGSSDPCDVGGELVRRIELIPASARLVIRAPSHVVRMPPSTGSVMPVT
jgi:hypothetical protein